MLIIFPRNGCTLENPRPKKSRKLDESTEEAVMMLTLGYGGVKRRRTELKEEIGEEEEILEEIALLSRGDRGLGVG